MLNEFNFTYFGLPNTEKLKIFGSLNKNVLCFVEEAHISKYYEIYLPVKKSRFLEIMKIFINLPIKRMLIGFVKGEKFSNGQVLLACLMLTRM